MSVTEESKFIDQEIKTLEVRIKDHRRHLAGSEEYAEECRANFEVALESVKVDKERIEAAEKVLAALKALQS